jgi:acyl-CoA thioesterase I
MINSRLASRVFDILWQICRAIGACAVVTASLVVFPNVIPCLVALWLLAYTLLVVCGRRGLVCLGTCAAVLAVKRLTPAPGLLVFLAVMVAVIVFGIVRVWCGEPRPSRRFVWVSILVLWTAWGGMTADWYYAVHAHHCVTLKGNRPVVCLGDSMTSLGMFGGYPQELRKRIVIPVVDMGTGGWSAKQVIATLMPEVAGHHPQAVVVELGAHDLLRFHSRAATKANLKAIIAACRQMDAEVVLMEIPRAYMFDPFWGLEREIAREEDVELMPDTAMRILFLHSPSLPPGSWWGGPYLTDESGIHPNAAGNQVLAEHVTRALERLYGPAILRPRRGYRE